ncbi:MAG TPA: aromatic-ring-hydroxylating dioxygenase subunit beta [Solirubrobacteraceae bacterium]|nr:aromatic-ring-hydroxylating dioxygenase subunit beta [Solirubrobacteraceae bacterium]
MLDLAARMQLQYEVEQFLYHEAQLLDERRYDDWLALFSMAIEYTAPVRITREGADDVVGRDGLHLFDDDYGQLELRVAGVQVKSAWAEIPPSRTRRIISNVRVEPLEGDDVHAHSNFVVYRSRLESIEHWFVGSRTDVLRRLGDERWQIRKREIVFDNVAFHTDNISILF